MEQMEQLRSLLGRPSERSWSRLLTLLSRWRSKGHEGLDVAMEYVDAHLEIWPDRLRLLSVDADEWQLPLARCLKVEQAHIEDLSGVVAEMKARPWLVGLQLEGRYIVDISALAELPHLEHLGLFRCPSLQELEPLHLLPHLRSLRMEGCGCRFVGLSETQQELEEVSLKDSILDLSTVAEFQQLHTLRLDQSFDAASVAQISGLPRLEALEVLAGEMEDLSPFAALEPLRELVLRRWSDPSLRGLGDVVQLRTFGVEFGATLLGVDELGALHQLEALSLWGTERRRVQLQHVGVLSSLGALRSLCFVSARPDELEQLATLTQLETLQLRRCDPAMDIQSFAWLSQLTQLKELELLSSTELRDASCLASLTSLERLVMRGCGMLSDVGFLAPLEQLRELVLELSMVDLDVLGQWDETERLERLDLASCRQLQRIDGIAKQRGLRELILRDCSALRRIDALAGMERLERLDLQGCDALEDGSVLRSLPGLLQLQFQPTEASQSAFEVSHLLQSTSLDLSGGEFENVDFLAPLTQLRELHLRDCRSLVRLDGLSLMRQLRVLDLRGCTALESLEGLEALTSLVSLSLDECAALTTLAPLAVLAQLKELSIVRCTGLTTLDPLSGLMQLEKIDASYCTSLRHVDGLASLTRLRELQLFYCASLRSIQGLGQFTAAQCNHLGLALHGCEALESLEGMPPLSDARLTLSGCTGLRSLDGIGALPHLEGLFLEGCASLTDLQGLKGLSQLRCVKLSGAGSLEDVEALSSLSQLEEVSLGGSQRLCALPDLSGLSALRSFSLGGCPRIQRLDGLAGAPALERVKLWNCEGLVSLDALAALPALRNLEIALSPSMRDLHALGSLPQIESLRLTIDEEGRRLDPLAACPNLRELSLITSPRGVAMPSFSSLPLLKRIDFQGLIASEALDELGTMERLEALSFYQVSGVRTLTGLVRLPTLDSLVLAQLPDLVSLGAWDMPRLRHLRISKCELTHLDELAGVCSLERLVLEHVNSLKSLRGLVGLPRLRGVALFSCQQIEEPEVLLDVPGLESLLLSHVGSLSPEHPVIQSLSDRGVKVLFPS